MTNSDRLEGIEFRVGREHERIAFNRALHRGFSGHFRPQVGELEYEKAAWDPMSSAVLAFDGDEMVGTTAGYDFRMAVPGGVTKLFGVTEVTVAATHRRRGILRSMMRQLLAKGRDEGHHIAGLWASESNIYGRFGFGISGETHVAKIDTRFSRFRAIPESRGRVRFAGPEKMREIAPKVFEAATIHTPGMIYRRSGEWDWRYNPGRIANIQKQKPFFVVCYEDETPTGYAEYSVEEQHLMHLPSVLTVHELVAATTSAETTLWRYILDIDLVNEVHHNLHPKKSNLLWLLDDPRKLSLEPYDSFWVRLLDPVEALASRTYSAEGDVVIRIVDDFCPWVDGVYRLTAGRDGSANCEETDRGPDVTLSASALGTIYMGSFYLADLQRAGRVEEHRHGAVRTIDTMFPTSGVQNFLPEF